MAKDSNDKFEVLQAQVLELTTRLAAAEAKNQVTLVDPSVAEYQRMAVVNAAKRAELKATTKKKDGVAYYMAPTPSYRQGVLSPAGVVSIPEDEDPSVKWTAIDPSALLPGEGPQVIAAPASTSSTSRPSDQSVA